MASSASSKEWKDFLLSPKVLVPVGVVTVGIAATVGGYVCYRRHKGKSEQPKKPKASTTGPGLVSPPKSSDNAKVSGEGSNGADKDKKPANVPPTSNDEQGNKKDGSASEEKSPLEQANDWRLRGNKWFRAERYDKALQYYKEALKVCPTDKPKERAVFHQNIAAAYERFAQGEKDKEKHAEYLQYVVDNTCEALSLDPQYAKPYARRARAYTMLGRDLDALYDYTAVTMIDEDIGKMVAEDFEKMVQKIAKERVQERCATRTWPPSPESTLPDSLSATSIITLLSVSCQQRYLSSKGLSEIWSELDREEPEDGVKEEEREVVEETDGELSSQPLARAVEAFERKDYRGAVTLCDEALEKGAEKLKPFAGLLKGTLFQLWHVTDLALSELEAVLSMPQATSEAKVYAHIMRAEVFVEGSEESAALVEYERALKEDKNNVDIYLFRAKLFLSDGQAGNPARGLEDMQSAYQMKKKNPKVASSFAYATFKVGVLTNSMQMIEEAISLIKSMATRHPNNPVVFSTYGHMLQESLQVELAMEQFSRAVELEPSNALLHISLCFSVVFAGGSPEEAEKHADKAIEVDPYCGLGYQAKASMELQKSHTDEGMKLYERALQLTLSRAELEQCMVAHLLSEVQVKVCAELGLNMQDVMKRAENNVRQNLGNFGNMA